LSADTQIEFGGDRFVHGFLCHKFSGERAQPVTFTARARQFSSYVLLLGKISGPSSFDPTYGMIVRNKDEFTMPLDMETIPTAKEFKDAISSLSTEQQDFCKAFRGMQLSSTLFGVVVIQIKPQMEKLLNLPPDCLSREIALTEQLMEMFIKYQLPSDLLAFDQGEHELSEKDPRRLYTVQGQVSAMHTMITCQKWHQLLEEGNASESTLFHAAESAAKLGEELGVEANQAAGKGAAVLAELLVKEQTGVQTLVDRLNHAAVVLQEARLASEAAAHERQMEQQRYNEEKRALEQAIEDTKERYEEELCYKGGAMLFNSSNDTYDAMYASDCMMEQACAMPMAGSFRAKESARGGRRQSGARMAAEAAGGMAKAAGAAAESSGGAAAPPQQQQQAPSDEEPLAAGRDYTQIPKQLDAKFEELDSESAMRPTIIKPGSVWTRKSQKGLLGKASTASLSNTQQKSAKDEAFDLLDALTKAGALSCDHASLHVVIAGTHCFDSDLMDTVVQDNVNPIQRVERSTLIMANTILEASVEQMVANEHYESIQPSLVAALPAP